MYEFSDCVQFWEFGNFFFDKVFDCFDVVVGGLFDVFDVLGVFKIEFVDQFVESGVGIV